MIESPTRPMANICSDSSSPKLRIENLHYDLTEEDLDVSSQTKGNKLEAHTDFRICSTELDQFSRQPLHMIVLGARRGLRMSPTKLLKMRSGRFGSLMVPTRKVRSYEFGDMF